MPGPLPNPNARRRNVSSEWTVLEQHDNGVPDLPGDWSPAARAAWASWWSSPMASQWDEADVPTLVAALLGYQLVLEGDIKGASEVRQIGGDRFGLSPLGRAKNRWHLPEADVEDDADVSSVVTLRAV